jgi:hypothetical protein
VSVVCRQVEVSATGWSLVQESHTECGVSKVCDREASTMRTPRPSSAYEPLEKKMANYKSVKNNTTKIT